MVVRQTKLEQKIRELEHKRAHSNQHESSEVANEKTQSSVKATKETQQHRTAPITLQLQKKNVLCVGDRSGNVASYRDLIERVGGRFAHHDGAEVSTQVQ